MENMKTSFMGVEVRMDEATITQTTLHIIPKSANPMILHKNIKSPHSNEYLAYSDLFGA